jgi:hypothetical protein
LVFDMHGKLGIAVVGFGGAVGTTMAAGIDLLRKGVIGSEGLPIADFCVDGLAKYTDIVFAGWDLFPDHLAKAAEEHDVLTHKQFLAAEESLKQIKPWPAVGDSRFLSLIDRENMIGSRSHRPAIEKLRADLADLASRCDSGVVLNLAATEQLAAELGVKESCLFTGRCASVPDLLAASDVCLLTSQAEGFSNSILEYMAAGCAGVATNVGGASEAIVEGETGHLVSSGDDAAMAARIVDLLRNPERRVQMGHNGRRVVEERFSLQSRLSNTSALYQRMLH